MSKLHDPHSEAFVTCAKAFRLAVIAVIIAICSAAPHGLDLLRGLSLLAPVSAATNDKPK